MHDRKLGSTKLWLRLGCNDRCLAAISSLLLLLIGPDPAAAQGLPADYDRADGVAARAQGKLTRARVVPHWFAENDRFWYRVDLGQGRSEFVVVDAVQGAKQPAFDHAKVAAAIAKLDPSQPVGADKLPIESLEIDGNGSIRLSLIGGKRTWRYESGGEVLTPADPLPPLDPAEQDDEPGRRRSPAGRPRPPAPAEVDSPDARWTAFHRGHELYLREKATAVETLIRTEGVEKDDRSRGIYWSPDSTKLIAVRVTDGDDRKVWLVESTPNDQLQPKLSSYDYLKPGDRIPIDRPYLYDLTQRKTIEVAATLFDNPWSIDQVRWDADSSRFTFLYNQRGHQVLRVVAVDAATGTASPLIEDRSPTFIDYSNKTYLHFTKAGDEILWMSERSGWNHLYRIDARTGAVKNAVTQGDWLIRAVDRVDDDQRQVWLQVLGIDPAQDPYQVHHIRVNFDGSGLVRLTEADGNHRVRYSPDRRFLLDTYSRVDLPPVTELRRVADGGLVLRVDQADSSLLLAAGIHPPERFVAPGRDGKTAIHGIIIRPTNYDKARQYPVLEAIYAGPQGAFVPKTFAPLPRHQALAELGFIVVQIDGMGTNWRSKAFHDVCSKNLADAGFPDRISWLRAAAEHDPALDLTRVGIFGGSAGGQNALGALLWHGDFYRAAAADCGCHDNRMDKIWWNEAWMGWPIGPHYAEQSNVTNAHRLTGALLLTVGELDHNVDPASTMQVVHALIRANKDFELIVFPGADHGAGGGTYGERRRRDFFVRHLLHVQPPTRNLVAAAPSEARRPGPNENWADRRASADADGEGAIDP